MSTPPVRVLWLVNGLGRGGAEQLLLSLARAMDPSRINIDVAYRLPHKDALVGALEATGAKVHCLSGPSLGGLGWPLNLRRLIDRGNYDVVHTHSPLVGSVARFVSPPGTQLVHTEHNMWDRYRLPTRLANAATIHRNTRVWAVSRGVAESVRPFFSRPHSLHVEILHHGLDTSTPHTEHSRSLSRDLLGVDHDDFVVGTVGSMTAKKDQETLLAAVAGVRCDGRGAHLVIIGDGPRRGAILEAIRVLGMTDRVTLTGVRDDVSDLLPGFDVFALSSLYEGLPLALLEAMSAAVPPVATAVGGIPEVITHGRDGLLVPPRDIDALASALGRLAAEQSLRQRIGEAARTRAHMFGIGPAADELTAAYGDLACVHSAENSA